ncbi:hypothetical protein NDU88_000404 [Pleurodeles waltl]|uniref:Uncharacterized protein n=1 Tax=Pleurodeles waltl TaxID=8319 RepID=A0AAV7S6V3_PLEWA|nr:hypothetical protein NDU88_000404 [Pleurodeles waltl]
MGIRATPFRAQTQLQRGPAPPDSPRCPPVCLRLQTLRRAHPCAYSRNPLGSRVLPRPPGTGTGRALARYGNSAARHVLPLLTDLLPLLTDQPEGQATYGAGTFHDSAMMWEVTKTSTTGRQGKMKNKNKEEPKGNKK